MSKRLLFGAASLGALVASETIVLGAENYTFALVPRNTNSPYFDEALAGCKKAESELGKTVQCLYIGPGRNGDSNEQALIVSDLISHKVDGIAVAPSDAQAIANALQAARAANIPVVTWYSDLSANDSGLRAAFIGSDNYSIGVDIAKAVMQNKPKGGVVCIQASSASATNDIERIHGIRDTLAAKASKDAPVVRLSGQNGWKEADGCPLYSGDDAALANQQIADVLARYPNLDAITLVSGLAQLRPPTYKETLSTYKDRIASGALALVSVGILPAQLQLMKEGFSSGQIGQRPFEMGYNAMYLLKNLKEGNAAPKDAVRTELSVCAPKNVDTCANY